MKITLIEKIAATLAILMVGVVIWTLVAMVVGLTIVACSQPVPGLPAPMALISSAVIILMAGTITIGFLQEVWKMIRS